MSARKQAARRAPDPASAHDAASEISTGTGDRLWEHELMKALVEAQQPLIDHSMPEFKAAGKRGRLRFTTNFVFSATQAFTYRAFRAALLLLDTFDRLAEARAYMEKFPRPRAYEAKRISAYAWLEYHYYYHGVLRVSVGDRALALVDRIADLDNAPKNCTQQVVMNNRRISNTPVERAMKRLMAELQAVREERNASVHRGQGTALDEKYGSVDLELLSIIGHPMLRSRIPRSKRPGQKLLDMLYRSGVDAVIPELIKSESRLGEEVRLLLDALLPVYRGRLTLLKLLDALAKTTK